MIVLPLTCEACFMLFCFTYICGQECQRWGHGLMNYKDSWPVNRICGILFNRFYRMEILSLMVCIFDPACERLPPWTKELYGTCVLLPLYCTFSLTSSPLAPFPMYIVQYIHPVCNWGGGWGGVEMYCGPYSAGVLHSVSDQIQNLQNCFITQTKRTSKDDIKGLVLRGMDRIEGKRSLTDG